VAQALERASEDRSATPDPVMAALAERYPGAPAHWLAHVAERTSQLAEAGEAPLSLNSDPAAWPSARPDGPAPPSAQSVEPEPASRGSQRPTPRRDTDVPTLAALRDRSSEVWLRPDVQRPRRPRPVFAAVTAAPASERAPSATPGPDAPPRRPHSPLTFIGAPSPAVRIASEPLAPMSDTAGAKAPQHQTAWSEPPPSRATPDATNARLGSQGTTEKRSIDFTSTSARPTDDVEDRPKMVSGRLGPQPTVHRQRSWFFAKAASGRLGRPLELSIKMERRPEKDHGLAAEAAPAVDPPPTSRAAGAFSTSAVGTLTPDRTWRMEAPTAPRRNIFQKIAARRAPPRPRTEPIHASESIVSGRAAVERPSARPDPAHPPKTLAPSRAKSPPRAGPAFSLVDRNAPRSQTESREPRLIVHRAARLAFDAPSSIDGTRDRDKRSIPTPLPRTGPRPASRGVAVSSRDDRWPALPPMTLASPHGVEASSPRWDVLAREQEEGRWSV